MVLHHWHSQLVWPYHEQPDVGCESYVCVCVCCAGSGRAGKQGRLAGSKGSLYEGGVLAGRPHGWGQYYVQVSTQHTLAPKFEQDCIQHSQCLSHAMVSLAPSKQQQRSSAYRCLNVLVMLCACSRTNIMVCLQPAPDVRPKLVYEGEWVKGIREGTGTYYYANGEVYNGQWQRNQRNGQGTALTVTAPAC